MSRVIEDKSEWVFENSHSLIKADAMFSNIAFGFCWIPPESHIYILLYLYFPSAFIIFSAYNRHACSSKNILLQLIRIQTYFDVSGMRAAQAHRANLFISA